MNEREYDGRANFAADDEIEALLDAHFARHGITQREVARNFQIYTRRVFLKRFLAHYELFRITSELPGDIVELGVYRGQSLMSWANFLELRNMGDRGKQVIGFDNWAGFRKLDAEDGPPAPRVNKVVGGYNGGEFKDLLLEAIEIFDRDRFVPYKPRVVLVDGDIEETVPQYVTDNPGLRISLLHVDCDLYAPTKVALEHLWPRVVRGGVLILDDYGVREWAGESQAVDEYFADKKIAINRFPWTTSPGCFVVKP